MENRWRSMGPQPGELIKIIENISPEKFLAQFVLRKGQITQVLKTFCKFQVSDTRTACLENKTFAGK